MYYAGIGSRETPAEVLTIMERTAGWLARRGYTLRSGGAKGADSAFEKGAKSKEIFTAQGEIPDWAFALARKVHPRWDTLSEYVRRLHARNGMQILGKDGDSPVKFVLCWTKKGEVVGGTGQAIRVATLYGIPVINLYRLDEAREMLRQLV